MKNILVLLALIYWNSITVYAKVVRDSFEHFVYNEISCEEKRNIKAIHDELIEEYNNEKEKIILLRINIQDEMIKEKPDWNRIQILTNEKIRLQKTIEKKISEFWENIRYLQIKNENKKTTCR